MEKHDSRQQRCLDPVSLRPTKCVPHQVALSARDDGSIRGDGITRSDATAQSNTTAQGNATAEGNATARDDGTFNSLLLNLGSVVQSLGISIPLNRLCVV